MGNCVSLCCCQMCNKKQCDIKSNCCKKIFIKTYQKNNTGKINISIK